MPIDEGTVGGNLGGHGAVCASPGFSQLLRQPRTWSAIDRLTVSKEDDAGRFEGAAGIKKRPARKLAVVLGGSQVFWFLRLDIN
jgi:hypothetical protein